MEQLIQFTLINKELNDEEFNEFIMRAIKLKGRKSFESMLFKSFKNNPEKISELTTITQNIINSRQCPAKTEQETIKLNKLDKLPSEMIVECASFLSTIDYTHFGHCNQRIYKSIYIPISRIQTLSHAQFMRYPQSLSMMRFKNVTHLEIDLDHFIEEVSTSNQSIWRDENSIQTLKIMGDREDYDSENLQRFINENRINCRHITKLEIDKLYIVCDDSCIYDLLSEFPELKHLKFGSAICSEIDDEFTYKQWEEILAKLCYLEYSNDAGFIHNIEFTKSQQIEALKIQYYEDNEDRITQKYYPKLTELHSILPDNNHIGLMIRQENIRAITVDLWQDNFEWNTEFIFKMIQTQRRLEIIRFALMKQDVFNQVLDIFERALFSNKNTSRWSKILCICFEVDQRTKLTDDTLIRILRLVALLEFQEINDFEIKVIKRRAELRQERHNLNRIIMELMQLKTRYQVQFLQTEMLFHFTISNKDKKVTSDQLYQPVMFE